MAIHYNRYYVDIRKIEFYFYLWNGGHYILIKVISKLQGSIYSMILLVNTKSLMTRHWSHLITCSLMCPEYSCAEYWLFLVGISPKFDSWNTCWPHKVPTWASSQHGACIPRAISPKRSQQKLLLVQLQKSQNGRFIVIVNLPRFNINTLNRKSIKVPL